MYISSIVLPKKSFKYYKKFSFVRIWLIKFCHNMSFLSFVNFFCKCFNRLVIAFCQFEFFLSFHFVPFFGHKKSSFYKHFITIFLVFFWVLSYWYSSNFSPPILIKIKLAFLVTRFFLMYRSFKMHFGKMKTKRRSELILTMLLNTGWNFFFNGLDI